MGIRCTCPNGHKLNVKEFLAGKRAVCPSCGAKFVIPTVGEANGPPATVPPATAGAANAGVPLVRDTPRSADAAEPSIMIPIVEPPTPPAIPAATSSPPTPSSPAFDFAAKPTAPVPLPVSKYAIRRQRSRRLQMQIAVVLLLAVIVLAAVLIWVLSRGPTATTSALHNSTHLAAAATQAYVAEAEHLV